MRRVVADMLLLATSSSADARPPRVHVNMDEYQRVDDAALQQTLLLALRGDADAQFWRGCSFADGKGVPADDREAAYWYRKAAEQGHADAQLFLGFCFADGKGVPADDREAASWYRKAAEQGHADAQLFLGLSFADGKGVPEPVMDIMSQLEAALADDEPQPQAPVDDREAVFWYRKAAEQGHAHAQFCLGLSFADGKGVPADDREAAFWCRKAAEQGHPYAQFFLGLCYADGTGVPADDVQAYAWIKLASVKGGEEAAEQRTRLRQRMTPAEIAEAQELSRELAAQIADSGGEPTPASVSGDPVHSSDPSHDAVRQAQSYLALLATTPGRWTGFSASARRPRCGSFSRTWA